MSAETDVFAPAALLSGEPGTILGHRIRHRVDYLEHIEIANFIHGVRERGLRPTSPPPSEARIREICGYFDLDQKQTNYVVKISFGA